MDRVNLSAQIANSTVQPGMLSAEVHPKMTPEGRYPREFDVPRRLEQLIAADGKSLASLPRILSWLMIQM